MFDYRRFHDVFPAEIQPPYNRNLQNDIEKYRRSYDGVLFLDRVLKALGIANAKSYPPKSDDALRHLHQQICEAGMSTHHKLSLFYYILLDFDVANERSSVSEGFSNASSIPTNYQIFMKGLWHMDRQDFEKALEYVAHPSLIPDFADEIIVALVRHAPNHDDSLALSYFHTVQPILKSSVALELLFRAMTRTNAFEALLYSRTHPEHTRQVLFRQLLATILDNDQADATNQMSDLAFLPLEPVEEAWLEEYILHGDGKSSKKAKETLLARKIAGDQFGDIAKQRVGGHWAAVLQGIRGGIEGHSD